MKLLFIASFILNIALIGLIVVYFPHDNGSYKEQQKETKNFNDPAYENNKENVYFRSPFGYKHIQELKTLIDSGSVLVVDSKGQVLLDYHSNEPLIPASTLKVITSLAALHYLGEDYHFHTEFKIDSKNNLFIKGYGDPFLTSEEIQGIALRLAKKGMKKINSISLDGSYFANFVMVPGNENTYKAYDAKNSALAANFNTIAFKRLGSRIVSGEKETPFVPYSLKILKQAEREDKQLLRSRKLRISIKDKEDSLLYFGYLFKAFSKKAGIKVKGKILLRKSPSELPVYYNHRSSKSLSGVIQHLLEHSNNFMANQILLTLGAYVKKQPATLEQGVAVLSNFVKNVLKIKDIKLSEGSGLSYANKVTARHMIKILGHFKRYRYLLKEVEKNVYAKSGGLKTVKSLVGFMDTPRYGEVRFAIILNQSYNNKPHILKMLMDTFF
ncbi:MAG TPA: hypothetical protein ENI73_05000 [Spirochaetes bacterium]|nr:hypothetical protein [Spirochaetota bacterium]